MRNKDLEEIKKDLEIAKKRNIEKIVFNGGEPTINPNIIKSVNYAKGLGFKKIAITTNGRMFSYIDFSKKMKQAGLTNAILSIHGHKSELHDYLTRVPGSFNQVFKAINNLKKIGIEVESNTTITKINYKFLPEIFSFLLEMDVNIIEAIFVHPGGNALKQFEEIVPSISDAASYVHKALDLVKKKTKKKIYIEAFPLCLMKGYENYMAESNMPKKRQMIAPDFEVKDINFSRKNEAKIKAPQCDKCIGNDKCEGVWYHYGKIKGFTELKAIK
jgi:MoaA/NifB/PqqE/SkfB family radical SAM enzyme